MKICKVCKNDSCIFNVHNCPHFKMIKYGLKVFEGPQWYSHNSWNYEYQDSFIKIVRAFFVCIKQYMNESTWARGDKIVIYKMLKNGKKKIIFNFKFPISIGNSHIFILEKVEEKELKHFKLFDYIVVLGEKP